jgi:hypothetical protein
MPTVPNSKPFFAYVGAGEAALTRLRTRVTALPTTLKTMPAQVKSLPALAPTLAQQAKDLRVGFGTKAEKLYDEFAARGEKIVSDLRGGKATTTTTAKPVTVKPATAKPAAKKSPAAKVKTTPVVAQPTAPVVPAPASANGTAATQDNSPTML